MAALTNTVTSSSICKSLDVEMIDNFTHEVEQFMDVLGIVSPEVVAAGTALYQYKVTGSLSTATVAEGDEIPLSKYEVERTPVGETEFRPYRKLTTAQAILKGGFVNSIMRTDRKMLRDIRADVVDRFYTFIKCGTAYAVGAKLQAALAQGDAVLGDKLESNHDSTDRVIHFLNRFDVADYLADAEITNQNLFGMTYLENFLGVENVLVSSRIPKGFVYATPSENLHLYAVDFAALSQSGLDYTVQDGGLIGVHHSPAYNRASCETFASTGCVLTAEVKDFIVSARIGGKLADLTVDQLKAVAAANAIDITGKTTKDDITAVLTAAGVV